MVFSPTFSQKIDNIKVAKLLFYGAIFLLPFQISTIIFQPDIYLSGQANQFNNATLYLTDILVILSAIFFFPKKSKKELSIGDKRITIVLATIAVIILALNFSNDIFPMHWMLFRILIFAIIYLLLINKIATQDSLTKVLILAGTFQSIIAIMQFGEQKSIGLSFLGEPNLEASNIAKIDVNDSKIIRSYGTMPHPNILAGFLTISVILGMKFKKWMPLIGLCIVGIILTFSRSAMVAIAICMLLFTIANIRQLKKYYIYALIGVIAVSIAVFFTYPSLKSHIFSTYEINERLESIPIAISMIEGNLLGVGWQNSSNLMQQYTEEKIKPWDYQPIHNIYLLITAELGIFGIALVLFLIFYSITSGKDPTIKYALIALCIIGLFDHYLYTLYQGQVIAIIIISIQQLEKKTDNSQR